MNRPTRPVGRFFLCLLTLGSALSCPVTQAEQPSDANEFIQQAQEKELATDPLWERLIYADPDSKESAVNSEDFFLSGQVNATAEQELLATIKAWFTNESQPDKHPACRFPARYLWLRKQLNFPTPPSGEPHCPRYEAWANLDKLRSISVMMVSGYLGNPASSFGHSLLKLNHNDPDLGGALLDTSFNFGALIPPNESTPAYVYRGMTGGYEAGFSDKPYYVEDQIYSKTEFRDVWEYELNLTYEERQLLAAHLWEIAGKKFTYYFMTKNCAYRMAELITLSTGLDFTPSARVWYAPLELFYSLVEVQRPDGTPLVKRIDFAASGQRTLYRRFSELSDEETRIANTFIKQQGQPKADELSQLPQKRQTAVLNALLAYYEYRIIAEREDPQPNTIAIKDDILIKRLRLPPEPKQKNRWPDLPPPTQGHATLLAGYSLWTNGDEESLRIHYAPYIQDELTYPDNSNRELVVLDGTGSIDNSGNVKLERLDAIRVQRLSTSPIPIDGESNLSWRVRVGAGRSGIKDDSFEAELSGGMGQAWALGSRVDVYALLDGTLRPDDNRLLIEPNLGLIVRLPGFRFRLEAREVYGVRGSDSDTRGTFEGRIPLSRNIHLTIGVEHRNDDTAGALGLNTYW